MGKTAVWLTVPETFITSMKSKILLFRRRRGFALIVTLSLMILLTVIAVGLLSLASITLRSTGEGDAMSKARANARLAMMLAIGELQKTAGPDKSITATSEIVADTPAKPNLTGVWDSWDYDVRSTTLDYDGPKTRKTDPDAPGFKGWLVSDSSPVAAANRDYANSPVTGENVELVGKGTLGDSAKDEEKVHAGRVPLTVAGKKTGNYAWQVSDESVKARINTYRDTSKVGSLSERRALLTGHRPDVSVMSNSHGTVDFMPDDSTNYATAVASSGKVISLDQAALLKSSPSPSDIQKVKSFRNDLTPYSLGLLTNVREGGLKQDLTSLFEMTTSGGSGVAGLPTEFDKKRVYQTSVFSGGAPVTGGADPYWNAFAGYYNSYKDLLTSDTAPTYYKAPPEEVKFASTPPVPVQALQYYAAPVIAKVELMFSLLTRDKHGPWKGNPGDYELHLLYTPVVTLHNPYNVSLRFDRLKVGISDVPVGFTFLVNNAKKNSSPLPLANLFNKVTGKKDFWIEIANWPSATATSPNGQMTLKPGQTMIFGPYINATEPFMDDNASYSDYNNNLTGTETNPLKAKQGFKGGTYGYDVDWLNGGILNVNKADKIAVEFKTLAAASTTFVVKATITSKGVQKAYGGMSFAYGNQTTLDKLFPDVLRFPKVDGISADAMHLGNLESPAGSLKAQCFALFSAYARTTNGGVDDTGSRTRTPGTKPLLPDGRLSGTPFLHNNPARALLISDLTREKPATQSHELNLLKLDGLDNVITFNSSDFRTNGLTNYKQLNGVSIKSGSYLEIPSGPLQSIADFRRSNVLASSFLPAFVQPIANSYASPLIATNSVSQAGGAYPLLDQSVLANHALYDRTYFSTFATVAQVTAPDGFSAFMQEDKPLRNQVFQSYLPNGSTVESAKSALFAGVKPSASAYKIAAQYQMVKGAFNVNSTRKEAWKAMLSSLNHTTLMTLWAKNGKNDSKASGGVPMPSMSLQNAGVVHGSFAVADIDDQAANDWNGARELTSAEINTLADNIVKQVRLRGPFQSLSEFVNRRIGANSPLTRSGALQNAIDDAELNKHTYDSQVPVTDDNVKDANLYGFKTPEAATGNPAAGAPGWVSQADILKIIEPAATVRSDTFVIRTCGETVDASGKVVAKAYAEAVLQRIPEYLDPADSPAAKVVNPNRANNQPDTDTPFLSSAENIAFGRRFVMVSFKWLSPSEI
jgi:hypothetical protein